MDFKKLKAKDKLEYILRLQGDGLTPQEISDSMGYSQLKNLNDFMRTQGYKRQDNRYIRQVEDICPANEIAIAMEDSYPIDIGQEDTYPTVSIQNKQKVMDIIDKHNEIMDIANNSPRIMNMLKWFESMEDTCPTQIIEVVDGLQIDYIKSKAIKTTVRVDDAVWTTFSNICKDKYSQFSKVDILSQILHEFNKKNI